MYAGGEWRVGKEQQRADGSSSGRGGHSTSGMDPSFKQGGRPLALRDSSPTPSPAREPAWPTKVVRLPSPHLFRTHVPCHVHVGGRQPPLVQVLVPTEWLCILRWMRQFRRSQMVVSVSCHACSPKGCGPMGQV